jgi:hypothetical protein
MLLVRVSQRMYVACSIADNLQALSNALNLNFST